MNLLDALEGILFPTTNGIYVAEDDPHKEFLQQEFVVDENAERARQSLVFFLNQWSRQLAQDNPQNNGLATPITIHEFKTLSLHNNSTLQMRIMFRPPPRYLSYLEQKSMEKGVLPDRKGAKLDSKSPGGIAISLITTTATTPSVLTFVAQRCGVDGDTVIKASSERAIIRRLDEALRIWKKVRDTNL